MHLPQSYFDCLKQLATHGACSATILNKSEISSLLEEAEGLIFKQRERETKTGVIQNFLGCDSFEEDSKFLSLAGDTAKMLNELFGHIVSKTIEFNDYSLQLYPASKPDEKFAISPHRDHRNCINLIAVYVPKGEAPFCTCPDRTGVNATEICSKPGDLILMRGTGFLGSGFRPFHFVGKVTEERMTFGLRQTVDKEELPKHYKL